MTSDPNAETRAELRRLHEQATLTTLTVIHKPGKELTGVDAEIADLEDAEPYALAVTSIPEIRAQITWDEREPRSTSPQDVLQLVAAATNSLPALLDEIDAKDEAIRAALHYLDLAAPRNAPVLQAVNMLRGAIGMPSLRPGSRERPSGRVPAANE